jgi:tetratricopeptide (TPR) repeat protein
MGNLLLALLVALGFAFWVGFYGAYIAAPIVGVLVGAIAYFFITRRTVAKITDGMSEVERHIGANRFPKAVEALERLRKLGFWQFGIGRAIDAQLGALIYAHQRDFDRARPYLENAPLSAWHAQAMRAADCFRRKKHDEMERVFDRALKRNKKAAVLYGAYAWCQWKRGKKDRAIEILMEGARRTKDDPKITRNLVSLQNGKKMKMRPFGPEWWVLHLEEPPRQVVQQPPAGARAGRMGRRR